MWALGVSPQVAAAIDAAVEQWLDVYFNSVEPERTPATSIPGLHDTHADEVLAASIAVNPTARVYAWAKMWLVHDSLFSVLRISVTGPRLAKHIDRVAPDFKLNPEQALALATYFSQTGQDAGLDDELWRRFKQSRLLDPASAEARDELLEFFVTLASKRFGMSYAKVGRVLLMLRSADVRTQEALRTFRDVDGRASARLVAEVARRAAFDANATQPGRSARDTLVWFASARSRAPSDRWKAERMRLESTLPGGTLRRLSLWVQQRPDGRYFGDKPYRDELFCLAWKTATWYLDRDA